MVPYRSYNRLLATPEFTTNASALGWGDTQTGDEFGICCCFCCSGATVLSGAAAACFPEMKALCQTEGSKVTVRAAPH